jgi:uroporphyrinogen-III decarboxylase
MDKKFYLELAASGLRMPVGTDLILHEHPDPEQVMEDGCRLGQTMETAARRFGTPLALSLMDLRLEKRDLLHMMGDPGVDVDSFHFHHAPGEEELARVRESLTMPFAKRNQAHLDAIRYIAERTDLVPVGMAIGPFSLATKLTADPITAIALAGLGVSPEDDPDVLLIHRCLALAEMAVARSLAAQAKAGAKAIMLCEPAANRVYLSPKQIDAGADIFERFVLEPNLRLNRQLAAAGVDLVFHDCGELTDSMVEQFAARLKPAILSLGSSRQLWKDARLVPKDVVLFGNLPTKSFYSDSVMPDEKVASLTQELIARMRETGHPHILGSECDVLYVPEAAAAIRRKVDVMLKCGAVQR